MPEFDFGNFTKGVEEQRQLIANRQATEMATQEAEQRIVERSAESSQRFNRNLDPLRRQVAESQQKADHARKLADSQNPLDRLRLMGLQELDPAGYRRDVRQARLSEDAQRAAVHSTIHSVEQNALQGELLAVKGDLNSAKLLEQIGAEKLTAIQTEAAMLQGNIAAAQTMQLGAIHGLGEQELAAALQQAKGAGGRTNVAGVDVSQRVIEDRMTALEDRAYQAGVKRAARIAQDENLVRHAQERELRSYDVQELMSLKQNGYKTEAGEQYHPEDVETAYARAKATQTQVVEQMMVEHQLTNFDTNTLAQEADTLKHVEPMLPLNSGASKALTEYRASLGLAATQAGPDKPIENRILAHEVVTQSRAKYDKAIESEAKKMAAGRSGSALLEQIYLSQFRGQPVPVDSVHQLIQERLVKNQTTTDFLPRDMAVGVERAYKEIYQKKLQRDPTQAAMQGSLTAEDKKLLQAEAIQEAIQIGLQTELQGRTTQILANQVQHPTHPLNGKWSPSHMDQFMKMSDTAAMSRWQQTLQLSPEDVKNLLNGQDTETVDSATAVATLQQLENEEFLINLDAQSPGLARDVVDWWLETGQEYVSSNQQAYGTAIGGDTSKHIARGLSNDVEQSAMFQYSSGLAMADSSVQEEAARRRADLLTFSNNPEWTQAALLNQDHNLSAEEKRVVWKEVIFPALQEAQANGVTNYRETSLFVERMINNYQPQSPETKSILKTLKRERAKNIQTLDDYQTLPSIFPGVPIGHVQTPNAARIQWYLDWYNTDRPKDAPKTPTIKIPPDFRYR